MTIAQQLNIKKFPFFIKDDSGNTIYCEDSNGSWWKYEYNSKGNQIYGEDSNGYWYKREYDDRGENIYWENSQGAFYDRRPKVVPEYTMEQLISKLGHEFKIKK